VEAIRPVWAGRFMGPVDTAPGAGRIVSGETFFFPFVEKGGQPKRKEPRADQGTGLFVYDARRITRWRAPSACRRGTLRRPI
jgi:hypothetical protein